MNLRNTFDRAMARVSLRRALAPRMPLFHPDFPAIVMWSEKSACTVAVRWFLHHIGKLEEAVALHPWVHVYENDVFKAAPGYVEACVAAIRSGRPVIKFVRNPYARAYSGFLETCHPRVLEEDEHWATRTRAAVVAHVHGADAGIATPYSFNQFAGWMDAQDARGLDPHLSPQFMAVEKRINAEPVRLEDHDNAFLHVEERFGLPSTCGEARLYTSGHHHPKTGISDAKAAAALDKAVPVERPEGFAFSDPSPLAIAESPAGEAIRRVCQSSFSVYGYDQLA